MSHLNIGEIITLGRYPQGAGGEVRPIEWQVMEVRDDRALLLSRYILDSQPFAANEDSVYWGHSHLRDWLVNDFAPRAFTEDEWARVFQPEPAPAPEADLLTWQLFGMDDATEGIHDALFVLSGYDIHRYFPGEDNMFCPGASARLTPWIAARDSDLDWQPSWWLRSSSAKSGIVYIVSPCDSIGASFRTHEGRQGVRPALWLRT